MVDADDGPDLPTGETRREGHGSRKRAPVDQLARGTAIGRYLILDLLGAGGMGVVYAAFDPELDRKVAIKLLQARPAAGSQGEQAWLLREAQALARLAHPNVIAVHDVGTLPGDRVFIAMEHVEGETLREWLRGARRPWREVLPVLRAAGAGLAAAHDAGLVHRDFKPDNVLVGKDGRVRVLDFGLARLQADGVDPAESPAPRDSDRTLALRSPLAETLTAAGTVIGTPAYMAPELHAGGAADARSDQFAFGVALFEALFWRRPFPRNEPLAPPTVPSEPAVPAALTEVALRALALDRDARFPSMTALLAALVVDDGRARRRAWLAITAVAALALGAAVAVLATRRAPASRPPPPPLCTGVEARLAGVWDDATRDAVHRAFVAVDKPFAEPAFAGVTQALDRYARAWTAAVTDSCTATRVRGDQTEEVMTLRDECLSRRLGELRAVTQLLADADLAVVARGDQLVLGLEPIDRCADVAALRAPSRPPADAAPQVAEVAGKLADGKAALLAGRFPIAIATTRDGIAIAERIRWTDALAEARLVEGAALAGLGRADDAAGVFAAAVNDGIAANNLAVTAAAAQAAATIALSTQVADARRWAALARAASTRVPGDELVQQRQLEVEGLVAGAGGDVPGSIALLEQALAQAERRLGKDHPGLWSEEELLGISFAKNGAYDRALPYYERALRRHEQTVGPDHPDIALLLTNLGPCYMHVGDVAKARAAYARALDIRERSEGGKNPMLVLTLNNMADGLIKAGDAAGAVAYTARALALADELLGTRNPLYHAVLTTHAEALAAHGQLAEARHAYDTAVALETTAASMFLPGTLTSWAQLEAQHARWPDARALASRAVAALDAGGATGSPELVTPLVIVGRAELALGRAPRARAALERAIAVGEQAAVAAADLAPARELLRQTAP